MSTNETGAGLDQDELISVILSGEGAGVKMPHLTFWVTGLTTVSKLLKTRCYKGFFT